MVLRADGVGVDTLLKGLIPLFELDSYAPPLVMMAAVAGDELDPSVEARYRKALFGDAPGLPIERIDRFAFYDRAQAAFAVVMTQRDGQVRQHPAEGVTPPFVG